MSIKNRLGKLEQNRIGAAYKTVTDNIGNLSPGEVESLLELSRNELEKRNLLEPAEIVAGRHLYECLIENGTTAETALHQVISAAKANGIHLSEQDIL